MEPSYSVQPYSVLADALSKFHTAPEWIQALWLVIVPVTVVGATACIMRAAREIAAALLARRGELQGQLLYAIYRASDGRWLVYAQGTVKDLTVKDCPEAAALPAPLHRPR